MPVPERTSTTTRPVAIINPALPGGRRIADPASFRLLTSAANGLRLLTGSVLAITGGLAGAGGSDLALALGFAGTATLGVAAASAVEGTGAAAFEGGATVGFAFATAFALATGLAALAC